MEKLNKDNAGSHFLNPTKCIAHGVRKIKITELGSQKKTIYPIIDVNAVISCYRSDRRIVLWQNPEGNLYYDLYRCSNTTITLLRPKKDTTFESINNFLEQKQ